MRSYLTKMILIDPINLFANYDFNEINFEIKSSNSLTLNSFIRIMYTINIKGVAIIIFNISFSKFNMAK